jgi:hypothetical protein
MTTLVLSKSEEKTRLARALFRGARQSRAVLVKGLGQRWQVRAMPAVTGRNRKSMVALPLEEDEVALMNSAPLVNLASVE